MIKRSCLVTGGAGFIGSHLVQALLNQGYSVKILDCPQISHSNLKNISGAVDFIEGDFADRNIARIALEGVDTLFHFASSTLPATAFGNSIHDVSDNLIGTLNLLEEALTQGCKRLIYPSSGGTVYGVPMQTPIPETHSTRPICSHGIVKLAIENYIHLLSLERGLKYTILRYSNPYGPRQRSNNVQGVIGVFAHKISTQQPIEIWGDGSVVRDFIYIDDVVRSTMLALSMEQSVNKIFNIGSGEGVSVKELVALIEDVVKVEAIVNFTDARKFDVPINILAIDKVQSELGWSPVVTLGQGLKNTLGSLLIGN